MADTPDIDKLVAEADRLAVALDKSHANDGLRHQAAATLRALASLARQQQVEPAREAVAWVDPRNLLSAKVSRERGGPYDAHVWSEARTAIHSCPLYLSPEEYGPDNPPRLRKPSESAEAYRIAMGWGSSVAAPAAAPAAAAELVFGGPEARMRALQELYGVTVQTHIAPAATAPQAGADERQRCIDARNRLNAALHGEGAVIDSLEDAVAEACHRLSTAPQPERQEVREALEELERALCVIRVVGTEDGYDLIRRESVLDIARRRIAALATQAKE